MGCQSRGNVSKLGFYINLDVPETLADDASALEDLLLEGAGSSNFVPHAGGSTDNVDVGDSWLEGVGMAPVLVVAVCPAIVITKSDIQVSEVIVGQDNLVLSACQFIDVCTDTPPMDDIIILNGQVNIFIGPVDHLLGGGNGAPELFLFLAEVNRERLEITDVVDFHPIHDVLPITPAAIYYLVTTEVRVAIHKGRIDVFQDFSDNIPR